MFSTHLHTIIFLLRTLRCGGAFKVEQKSLIQIAFANEQLNTTCSASFLYMPEDAKFKVHYYRISSEGHENIVKTLETTITRKPDNQTTRKTYTFYISPTEHASVTGTYYCRVEGKKGKRKGLGTFILFRAKGYAEPFLTMWVCLISITVILTVLSIKGTVLLFWNRKVVCPGKSPTQGPSRSEPSGSIYMTLEPHESDIYFIIKEDEKCPSHKKMPTAKASQQEMQGYNSVYENI